MKPEVIHGGTFLDTWMTAADVLAEGPGKRFNLILHASNPAATSEAACLRHNPRHVLPNADHLPNVASTIFPPRDRWRKRRSEFYRHFGDVYDRGTRGSGAWGTYFQRLISYGPDRINQLDRVISALRNWPRQVRAAAFVFHLSGPELDSPRPLGAPCLQFAQLTASKPGVLNLVAVYRSHDYFQKALGNLMGLTRLLLFIARHTGNKPGTLTCHSIYAFRGTSQANLRKLIVGVDA